MELAKAWDISSNDVQTFFDVENLYPSFQINIDDMDDLQKRAKLALTYIHKVFELCLTPNYFIFDNRLLILENSGPICLALMVVISEAFLQRLEDKAIPEAMTTKLIPLTYKGYVNDSHARFETIKQSHSFLHILYEQNKGIHNGKRKPFTKTKLYRRYHYKH